MALVKSEKTWIFSPTWWPPCQTSELESYSKD